jgi:hypothetical protein
MFLPLSLPLSKTSWALAGGSILGTPSTTRTDDGDTVGGSGKGHTITVDDDGLKCSRKVGFSSDVEDVVPFECCRKVGSSSLDDGNDVESSLSFIFCCRSLLIPFPLGIEMAVAAVLVIFLYIEKAVCCRDVDAFAQIDYTVTHESKKYVGGMQKILWTALPKRMRERMGV